MAESVEAFYDDLAESYHLMFENWSHSVARQAAIIGPLLEQYTGKSSAYVLDCACGIGTQTIGLAERGHILVGSDLSGSAVARAISEARTRHLDIRFHVADMRNLSNIPESGFDAVLAGDNALPHLLSQPDLERAAVEIAAKLKDSGILLATIRDYDQLLLTRPTMQAPAFYEQDGKSRFVHQVWQWQGEQYALHVYMTLETESGWKVRHFASTYRALRRSDLNRALQTAGLHDILWLEPGTTSFYQPIVIATKRRSHME
jgi:ubiquinone/menaquinone biosynthesis C-methylase UbiE